MSLSDSAADDGATETSLTNVLDTLALRTELVAIVALCTDHMRNDLHAVFEAIRPPQQPYRDTAISLLIDFQNPQTSILEEQQNASKRQQADIDSPRAQGLQRAALTYFAKWQVEVLRRLGEVLSVRPSAIKKARADAKAQAEATAKARQEKAYVIWAEGLDEETETTQQDPDPHASNILPEGFESNVILLSKDKRVVILKSVLLLLLSLEQYKAHSRILMLNVTRVLQLPESTLVQHETDVASSLLESAAAQMSADASTERQASSDLTSRRLKIGLAAVGGAALIGITGGLAAPVLAAGLGTLLGHVGLGAVASLLGPLATNVVLVGGLFGAYGGRMTSKIMEKYAQEVRDFKFLPVDDDQAPLFQSPSEQSEEDQDLKQLQEPELRKMHKLRVVIGISGAITDASDFVDPWKVFASSRLEPFGLRWEMEALLTLGRKITDVVRGYAWNFAKMSLASMLIAGLWPVGLLQAATVLDLPFAIAKTRADKAGKVLADAIINSVQGERPVTLVGFSLGARVIYSCLLQLAEQNAFGLVESVILMGAPTPSESSRWRRIRAMVSGRVVNVYSADDYVLGLLYRATGAQTGIAGVQAVEGVNGVENYDFTDIIRGHDKYRHLVGTVLQRIGFADLDMTAVQQQQEALGHLRKDDELNMRTDIAEGDFAMDDALAREDEHGEISLVDDEVEEKTRAAQDSKPIHETPNESTSDDEEVSSPGIILIDNE